MPQHKIHILSTRPLWATLVAEAKDQGIDIDAISFIETEPVVDAMLLREIVHATHKQATVVFTSMNAVEAVATALGDMKVDWRIYSIGTTTTKLVTQYFGSEAQAGTANDAAALANLIVKEAKTDEVVFFCGDQRRDELPGILQGNDIMVNEIIVYRTIATPHKIDKPYNGILFFSPSAVQSFFLANTIGKETIFFAIGRTTADAIKQYSKNTIIISEEPGKAFLVKKMLAYFSGTERLH